MSKQALEAFREKLSTDETLRSEMNRVLSGGGIKSTTSVEELVEFASARGFEFSAEEALGRAELSDHDLDRVVGGGLGDPPQFGEWIADVERPAAAFRGRYQLRLGDAQKLLSAK